jgi:hypothetical protein
MELLTKKKIHNFIQTVGVLFSYNATSITKSLFKNKIQVVFHAKINCNGPILRFWNVILRTLKMEASDE